ncbi:MAG: family 20 glycosylhydrolase [Pseudomonadota bacterium]
MKYDCRIEAGQLICTLTADRNLSEPVFCFSGMAPMEPVSGGTLKDRLGSYTEVTLPNLIAGRPHEVRIAYVEGYAAANRAWMPMGPHLETDDGIIELPPTLVGRKTTPVAPQDVEGLPIAPQPTDWSPANGTLLGKGFSFDDDALNAVSALAERQGMVFSGVTPIYIRNGDLPDDAYVIDIGADAVTITANSYGGRFYAGITLLTLIQQGPLSCGQITDTPRFTWRGQHLDTARHFYKVDTILALLDLMAFMKLNRFHWHFADDEAFRLEVDCLPEIWQKTALRGKGQLLPGLFSTDLVAGGTYTKDDATKIIARAKALNIEVLPEIETPAHALAFTQIFPDTCDPDDTGEEASVQGYKRNVLNPAMPRTWDIWEALVTEVGVLFPFGHIHLGCDELPKDTWMNSPKARALMDAEGLRSTDDLLGWTVAKLARFATTQGLRPAAWEEAARGIGGGVGNNAILFSWTGQGAGLDAARAGYDVVMTPAQHVYMDMAHTSGTDDWGASWAAFVDLPDTVAWDPVPDPDLSDRIIGVQGAFWSEFTSEDSQMWPMLMPRILGVAMMAWQPDRPEVDMLTALATRYAIDAHGRVALLPRRPAN